MRIIVGILFLILITFKTKAQKISKTDYVIEALHENFNNYKSLYFNDQINTDNYIKINSTHLFLIRKNKQKPYILLAKHKPLKDFILKTELRIGPSENKESSIGIVLKTQNNGDGGVIFEINKSREYKITQQNLNSESKQASWKKSNFINGVDKLNTIEVRSENNTYDIYVNDKFLEVVKSSANEYGINGIFINSDTKAKISYFYINTKEKKTAYNYTIASHELNQRIKELQKENRQLQNIIKKLSKKDIEKQNKKSNNKDHQFEENKTTPLLTKQINKITNLTQSNFEIKNSIIQKEFESNGIKPSELIKRTSKVQVKEKEDGKIYSVQIGVYMKEKDIDSLDDIWSSTSKLGTHIYYSGKFSNSNEAVLHLNSLFLKGYKNAFIITKNK